MSRKWCFHYGHNLCQFLDTNDYQGFNFTLTYISTEFKKYVILFALLVNMMLFTAEIRSGKLLNASNFFENFLEIQYPFDFLKVNNTSALKRQPLRLSSHPILHLSIHPFVHPFRLSRSIFRISVCYIRGMCDNVSTTVYFSTSPFLFVILLHVHTKSIRH